jgi:signal transduction histidine kinase
MDIYKKRSYWNMALAVFGLLILIITMVYSNFLAQQLKEREKKDSVIYLQAFDEITKVAEEMNDLSLKLQVASAENDSINHAKITEALNQKEGELNDEMGVYQDIVTGTNLQLIIEYSNGDLEGNNWGQDKDEDSEFLNLKKASFLSGKKAPLEFSGGKVYHFDSKLVNYINYFPYIQLLLVGSFILLGYFFLIGSKRSEQNRVWAGMAKETAHQLGTPISAIIAWIEHLKLTDPSEEQLEIVEELRSDVNRLELVADRFSKIGAEPVLTRINIYEEMDKCRKYMEKRAPRKVFFSYPKPTEGNLSVKINEHLFDWVIENLIRNSLDAMDGKGELTAEIYEEGDFINVDMTDTGKGIPSSKHSTVFEPGFTTKKRGWGLGLSLAKRIIENYHSGKIFVKTSKPGVGTTFTVRLPKI